MLCVCFFVSAAIRTAHTPFFGTHFSAPECWSPGRETRTSSRRCSRRSTRRCPSLAVDFRTRIATCYHSNQVEGPQNRTRMTTCFLPLFAGAHRAAADEKLLWLRGHLVARVHARVLRHATPRGEGHPADGLPRDARLQARPALLGSWDTFQGPSQTRMKYAAC